MRLFAQLSWYFRREWRRYLGAIALLIVIAILQLVPPKVVGIVVDGVTKQHYTAEKVWMWIGLLVVIAVMVYLLRYVWRVLLFGASYQLAVELREDFYRQLSRQHPAFYLRHRTGSDRAGDQRRGSGGVRRWRRGVNAGGLPGDGLRGADCYVDANQLAVNPAGAAADAADGAGDQA